MLAISFLLLAVACSSSDESGEQQPTTLTVYVYSPEHPMLIRGDVGNVNASFDEKKITRLQIWVFTNGTHEKVAYLDTEETSKETSQLNVGEGAVYQLPVSDEFAQSKPAVDVYVLANVTADNCGCSLDGNSTRDAILSAKIPENKFGLASPTTQVPNDGLPMAGALTSQPVIGEAPVLRVGTSSNIATVRLERAVSKVRFVFANTVGEPELKIKNIQLNAQMIPNTEYLIQQTQSLVYNTSVFPLWEAEDVVKKVDDPTIYIYGGQEAQVYESFIDQSELTKIGPFYLRESDKKLRGMITYQIGESGDQTGMFEMEAAGDFRRNHTWIVYAYHAGGGFLQMNAIYVKEWTTKEKNHEVYNW